MVACSAAGVHPLEFWDLTFREVFNVLQAAARRRREERMLAVFHAWHGAAFDRQKRLPDLTGILRKMEPPRVMSPREQRASILGIAHAMGAKVRYVKKAGG